jgi:DNA invertase Pin-like site-specific DNA recombinase
MSALPRPRLWKRRGEQATDRARKAKVRAFSLHDLRRSDLLDLGVDTTTPSGEMVANVMATFAQFERRLIGQRTKDALAVKKREGVKLGRPAMVDEAVAKRITRERRRGSSLRAIADGLNEAGVSTAHGGGKWHPSTAKAVLDRSG